MNRKVNPQALREIMADKYNREARQAWCDACRHDRIDPKDLTIKFSPTNPHRKAYDRIVQKALATGIRLDIRF